MAETNPSPNGARSRNQVSHEARWEEIVDASAQVFHEVASRVGILKGSLYYYIESKQDLLLAVIKREHERGLTTIEEDAAARAAPPPERLAAFIRRWMRITLETAPNSRSNSGWVTNSATQGFWRAHRTAEQ